MEKRYITTPIYYVNDKPHIGHAYTTIAADVLAGYWRLEGRDVLFLTGTDEHASKIAPAAAAAGKTPKEFCDEMSSEFRKAWRELGIKCDRFIRTTDPDHVETVRTILSRLHAAGHIYKGTYEGLYCASCEKFLSESDLVEGQCPDHGRPPEKYREENYFFRLSLFRDKLLKMLTSPDGADRLEILPVERRNEIIGKLNLGLDDISISRAASGWGVRLPFDESQTAYVWIDALINYVTGAGFSSSPAQFEKWWPADCHLMAKDILWFHSVIWPAVLIGAGIQPPRRVFAHGFFTLNGAKMSKTRGNVISPSELIDRYGADAARYLLVTLFPFGSDGDVSKEELDRRYNAELANNVGNLVNRTSAMSEKYFASDIPQAAVSEKFLEGIMNHVGDWRGALERFELAAASAAVQAIVDEGNKHIQREEPWKLHKTDDPSLARVMREVFVSISAAAVCLSPFMPAAAEKIWESSGSSLTLTEAARKIFAGDASALCRFDKTAKIPALFPRV